MSLIHVNWNPEDRQLRQFAWIGAVPPWHWPSSSTPSRAWT